MGGRLPGRDRCSRAERGSGRACQGGAAAPGTEGAGRYHESEEIRESPGQVEKSSHRGRLHCWIRRMQIGGGSVPGLGGPSRGRSGQERRPQGGEDMCGQHTMPQAGGGRAGGLGWVMGELAGGLAGAVEGGEMEARQRVDVSACERGGGYVAGRRRRSAGNTIEREAWAICASMPGWRI